MTINSQHKAIQKDKMMTDRVFEGTRIWEISSNGRSVEVYVFDPKTSDRDQGEVMITTDEYTDWGCKRTSFTMTAEEATALKEFLIKQGY